MVAAFPQLSGTHSSVCTTSKDLHSFYKDFQQSPELLCICSIHAASLPVLQEGKYGLARKSTGLLCPMFCIPYVFTQEGSIDAYVNSTGTSITKLAGLRRCVIQYLSYIKYRFFPVPSKTYISSGLSVV